jgi:N-sulfoglucosamine sulfohydrolase
MRIILFCLLLLLAPGHHAAAQAANLTAAKRPNVILVFIDDMGYADLSVTGNTRVRTENIDRLAMQGTLFTQFYVNAPICSPSRVAITTGSYPSRYRIDSFLESRQRNAARGMADYLDPSAATLARSLKTAGYATAHFGKWHMGGGRDVGDAPLPQEYGFDESITSFEGLGDRYLWRDRLNEQSAQLGRGKIEWTEKTEMTRHYVDHAIDFMRRNRDRPFYVNVWPNDVHDPFDPRPELMAKYGGAARNRYEQQLFAVLEDMDRQLGRLFDEVDRLGLAEETIIILTGDNGPTDWPHYYREGMVPPGSSGPFRGRKWSLYEGGIREPLIVRWPGRTPAGVVNESTVLAAFDLFPSLAALAGVPLPRDDRIDGENMSAALLGRPIRRLSPIFWYYPNDLKPGNPDFVTPKLAVRDGPWKLLVEEDGSGGKLYNLEADRGETRDVVERHPALAELLRDKVLAWRNGLAQRAAGRANIVLFIGDDLGALDIGPYGNVVVRTPHLDRLAAESLLFTRAFAPSATCSPSRSAMYTGLMPLRNGAHGNHSLVRDGTRSLTHYFGELGYRVALAGKLHVGPREVFPFEYVPDSNVPEPGYAGKGVLWTDLDMGAVDRWLSGVERSEPFVLLVADHSPHVIWPERAEYDPAEMDVPPTHIDTREYRRSRARYYTDITKMDRNVGALLESLRRHGLSDNTIVAFTADQGPQLAFGKWGLYDPGIQAPLIIRWPGRAPAGERTDALVSLVDLLPTFLEAAGGRAPQRIDGRSFLAVLSGRSHTHRDTVFASHTGDGRVNRTPMRMVRTERYKYILNLADTIYTTHIDRARDHDGGREYWRSWRERSFVDPAAAAILWRYHHRPPEELYDLERDSNETRNLADQPHYAEILGAMRARMAEWRAQQGDVESGPESLERKPGVRGPPYVF